MVCALKDETAIITDKGEMFICHERGAKRKSDSLTGFEPMTPQILVARCNALTTKLRRDLVS